MYAFHSFILNITESETRSNLRVSRSTQPTFRINFGTDDIGVFANTTSDQDITLIFEAYPSRGLNYEILETDGKEGAAFYPHEYTHTMGGVRLSESGWDQVFLRVRGVEEFDRFAEVSIYFVKTTGEAELLKQDVANRLAGVGIPPTTMTDLDK